jgi:hypothetical protein
MELEHKKDIFIELKFLLNKIKEKIPTITEYQIISEIDSIVHSPLVSKGKDVENIIKYELNDNITNCPQGLNNRATEDDILKYINQDDVIFYNTLFNCRENIKHENDINIHQNKIKYCIEIKSGNSHNDAPKQHSIKDIGVDSEKFYIEHGILKENIKKIILRIGNYKYTIPNINNDVEIWSVNKLITEIFGNDFSFITENIYNEIENYDKNFFSILEKNNEKRINKKLKKEKFNFVMIDIDKIIPDNKKITAKITSNKIIK